MMLKLSKLFVVTYSLSIFLILLFNSSTIAYAQGSGEAYAYSFHESPSSKMLLDFFDKKSDWKVTLYDLNDLASSERFLNMTQMLTALGVGLIPPSVCMECELKYLTWDEILKTYGSPLAGFFHDERLTAITVGITDYETLDRALMVNEEDVKVFTPYYVYSLGDVRIHLEEFFLVQDGSTTEIMVPNLFFSVLLLALADSVNPCTFALFTSLLFITLYSLGKIRAVATGFSFISAIFIGYYVLGLGGFRILAAIPNVDKALAGLGLTLGVLNIMRGLKVKFKSPIPKALYSFMELMVRKSSANILASFVLGLIATIVLLPCSSGPYMVGLSLISTLKDPIQAHLLLTLYNLILVIPLILVLATALASISMSHKIKVFKSTNLGMMELASGALLATVCIYLLAS